MIGSMISFSTSLRHPVNAIISFTRKFSRHSSFSLLLIIAIHITVAPGCGKLEEGQKSAVISYQLERVATNDGQNAILFDYPEDSDYYIRLTGTDVSSSVPLCALLKVQKRIELNTEVIGKHAIDIIIALPDRTEIIKDRLEWATDYKIPPDPIVSPQLEASNDGTMILLVSSSRGPTVKELWVGGDVETPQWLPIPDSSKVPIVLSQGEGKKVLSIKQRNLAGSESVTQELVVARKAIGPLNCKAEPVSPILASNTLKLQVSAKNDGPLAFRVMGDVEKIGIFKGFQDKYETEFELSPGIGEKKIVVYMRDAAENYCDPIPVTVLVDPTYKAEKVIADRLWTDDPNVTVAVTTDTFDDHSVEMFVSGGVEHGATTFQWIPYAPSVAVELTPVDGHRFVTVQIRDNGVLREAESAGLFLRPYVKLEGLGAVRTLQLSNMVPTLSLTVTGCSESYVNIPYTDALPCTVGVAPIEATYRLSDGTTVTRSVNP